MYVKSIVLDGFKSYGKRTEVSGFDPQFNAITGLNGSGKSNILDAICFVLGISNLHHVRVGNLQDLIFKSGQCGVVKATVSLTFDNTNPAQFPVGFENVPEITVSRQVLMGGKNKYMINGAQVQNKKIQDLFCSIQLNVNNPHFLIMQGRITKVLNMKPCDILAMVEEAAGTKMYELKKQFTVKTIEKKDAKIKELTAIIHEELAPKMEKFRQESTQYFEFKETERELENLLQLYQAFEYISTQKHFQNVLSNLEKEREIIKSNENQIESHQNEIKDLERVVSEMTKKAEAESNEQLVQLEGELKTAEKSQAAVNAKTKSLKDDIAHEMTKKFQLEKNLIDDEKALKMKQNELQKAESVFLKLKTNDERDNEAFLLAQKKFQALSSGMELNDEGEAETLLEQLMNARKEAVKADTDIKQSNMRLEFCQKQLTVKQRQRMSNANEMAKIEKDKELATKEINNLENAIKKLHFNEERVNELQERRVILKNDMRRLESVVDNFEARKPFTQFRYRDPEPNFNRNQVFGVVCRLFDVRNDIANLAIETAAGGRLYNVVIDSEVTGKKLLQNGDLQYRTTFIPLKKIQAKKMNDNIVKFAQESYGPENVKPALAYLKYDKKMSVVMEFIFGNIFICRDLDVARKVAFHDRIKKKCVTLEGDVVDPAGTLSGGAPPKGDPLLKQLNEIKQTESQLNEKRQEFEQIEKKFHDLAPKQTQFQTFKQNLEMRQHDLGLIMQRLQQTSQYKHQQEVRDLQAEIELLKATIETCCENERKFKGKIADLEEKVKNSKGGKEEQIKSAEVEMSAARVKAEKSRNEWRRKEQDYETFNLEIEELKNGLKLTEEQIVSTTEAIDKLNEKLDEILATSGEAASEVQRLQNEYKAEKARISEKNKDIKKKMNKQEELQQLITACELKIKEHGHRLKELETDCKTLRLKEKDCQKKVKERTLKEAEKMSEQDGRDLEKNIKRLQEQKTRLGRTINRQAQINFENHEKEYNEVKKKLRIVQIDKNRLIETIKLLDVKKEQILQVAHSQISRDFGSIFSTLLPEANAKLLPPTGQTLLQGLEVKVSLGGVWKDSLTELSGGQRSLAALSLILAMLLFKPAPLYILDEVDAALDLSHTQNIGQMLKTHFTKSQFIIVSLKDGMFSNANVLFKTQFVDGVSAVTRTSKQD